MYIVYTEYAAHCCHDVVLGICENINEVIEIIWTFSRFVLTVYNNTFEENNELIKIAKITQEDYTVLDTLYKKYEDKLLEYISNPRFNEWENESLNINFWYGVFDSEEKKDILFKKKDCNIIKNIIKNSILLE
jgi:hypothetical protein